MSFNLEGLDLTRTESSDRSVISKSVGSVSFSDFNGGPLYYNILLPNKLLGRFVDL